MTASTPRTPASKIRRTPSNTPGGPKVSEEKILVTVRLRPLSSKEQAAYDLIVWDCTDDHTIVSRNLCHERHTGPYTFDKVFDPICSTQKVYEEGARDVALSAINGINSTIFAYGQTSSGKTFTMRGITENAVKDIYEQIKNTMEKEFVLKFSALEIYNETVVDLLNRESGSLRLLDDPEKGTIVEKLTEEVVIDAQHLRHLINICEAQRQVGETSLNDKSSRSHQIIRLTIESSLRENSGRVRSFLASLSLVDLAGSERASQTNADGTRLKEGSHINRSLLTLTTVIRKLRISALKQEREYLAKRVSSELSAEERDMLYLKWDVQVEGKQKRRLQLVNKLWTDPLNMQHVQESAEIVAKLVGFCETGAHVSKEMFQLNFVRLSDKKTWMGWNLISNRLHL